MKATKAMNLFLRAIEVLPGQATDRRAWKALLGSEWDVAEPFLRPTGRIARDIDCPNPGGENCPRKIVHHHDGMIRAVCGDGQRMCESIDLVATDIEILQVDRQKLRAAIVRALKLVPVSTRATELITLLGRHLLQAGVGFKVFLAIPDPQAPVGANDIVNLGTESTPFVLLVPGLSSLAADAHSMLAGRNGRPIPLDECLALDGAGNLRGTLPIDILFGGERAALASALDETSTMPTMSLPPEARWADIAITFISAEVINVAYRNDPTRRFEPAHFGLMDGRKGKPNLQWTLLTAFARTGGNLPVHATENIPSFQKKKQLLSAALTNFFGIAGEPIPAVRGTYRTAFTIRDSGLTQGRQDQRLTNIRP